MKTNLQNKASLTDFRNKKPTGSEMLSNQNRLNNHWGEHLFHHGDHCFVLNQQQQVTSKSSRPAVKAGYKRPHQHWSSRIFATTASGVMAKDKLVVTDGQQPISEFEIRSKRVEVIIGSHEMADIVLEGRNINPFHVKIKFSGEQYQIEDLSSQRGTFINGTKITSNQAIPLRQDDTVRIMKFQIRLEIAQQHTVKSLQMRPSLSSALNHNAVTQSTDLSAIKEPTAQPDSAISPPVWTKGSTELKVIDRIEETGDVTTFRLTGATPLSFVYLPGQFVTLLLTIDGQQVQRAYSISSAPSRPHTMDLTVKRVPGGLVSNWLCDHVRIGDTLQIKGPAGRFSCLNKPEKKLLFIGAGSGITPLMSMTRWLFDTISKVDTKVLFSFRNQADVIFRDELALIKQSSKYIDIGVTMTRLTEIDQPYDGMSGRIDKAMLLSFANDLKQREIYLCGPDNFIEAIKQLLTELDFPMQQLHCESFNTATAKLKPQPPEKTQHQPMAKLRSAKIKNNDLLHSVTFAKSNITVATDEKTNLLELAEQAGIEIDSYCKIGSCAECMIKCVSGEAKMDDICDIDDQHRQQGWIYSCCAYAKSDIVLDI